MQSIRATNALKPLFLGGFRSGTTLLINLLGMHPEIAPWFETKFLCEAVRWMHVLKRPEAAGHEAAYIVPREPKGFDTEAVTARMRQDMAETFARIEGRAANGKASHERYPLGHDCIGYDPETAEAALARWSRSVGGRPEYPRVAHATGELIRTLGSVHCEALNKPVWGNKTPEIPRFAAELRDSLGPCRIVYLVRNGLEVVASARRLGWGDVELLAYNWKGLLTQTRRAMADNPGDYLELRYESLLEEPAASLDKVCDFAGIAPRGGEIIAGFIERLGAGAFDVSRLNAGKDLSPRERAAFKRIAGDLQAELGYP